MRTRRLVMLFLAACLPVFSLRAETPKLIVTILVDQLRYDYLERFHDQFSTNGFRLLEDRGAFMASAHYDYAPTVTGPGHASFLSGSNPSIHGIISNEWVDKNTRKEVYCVDDLSVSGVGTTSVKAKMSPRNFIGDTFADELRLRYQSKVIGISMKDRGAILPAGKKPAGAFWFESKSGNFVTSTYYMQALPDWVEAFNKEKYYSKYLNTEWTRLRPEQDYQFKDAQRGEGALLGNTNSTFNHLIRITNTAPYESMLSTPYANEILLNFAKAAIEGEHLGQGAQPDLLSVSFSAIDYVGHRFGPYSHEMQDILLRFDLQLADLLTYLDQKFGLANVMIVLTADHGVAPVPEFAADQGLDGLRFNETEFMIGLMSQLDTRYGSGKYFLTPKIYEGMLYFNHATLQAKQISVADISSFIRDYALGTGKYYACYTREQLLNGNAPGPFGKLVLNGYNAERSGDLVLIATPYTIPASPKTGTTHGTPFNYDSHVPVFLFGSAFKPGRYNDWFNITDIVPTLCTTLRMQEPAGCVGRAFLKALAQP